MTLKIMGVACCLGHNEIQVKVTVNKDGVISRRHIKDLRAKPDLKTLVERVGDEYKVKRSEIYIPGYIMKALE